MDDQYSSQATTRRNFKGAKILLIEDNPDQCVLIQTGLQECMPEVGLLVAATAEEGRQVLNDCIDAQSLLPRLILLDLYLPNREDGLQLVRLLKAPASLYRLIPITLISQSERVGDIQMGYDAGANSYIIKPTHYPQWLTYFDSLRQYWWHTVTLPPG